MTTFNKEELALVVRFVDKNEDIREGFVGEQRITGRHIASVILNTWNQLGLSVDSLRGQCYDSKFKRIYSIILPLVNQPLGYTGCFFGSQTLVLVQNISALEPMFGNQGNSQRESS